MADCPAGPARRGTSPAANGSRASVLPISFYAVRRQWVLETLASMEPARVSFRRLPEEEEEENDDRDRNAQQPQ